VSLSPRSKRTIYRLLAVFLAAGAGDAVMQFVADGRYDWRHLIAGLTTAAIIAAEMYLKQTDSTTASPSVTAMNVALENQASSVPPPKVVIQADPIEYHSV
jgi:hypothetical protein